MKSLLWSSSPFHRFKEASCQLLVNVRLTDRPDPALLFTMDQQPNNVASDQGLYCLLTGSVIVRKICLSNCNDRRLKFGPHIFLKNLNKNLSQPLEAIPCLVFCRPLRMLHSNV